MGISAICCNDGCSLATRVSRPSCLTDPHKFTHALTEQSILSLPHYKVDVGVFGRNGQMKVAIEVLHTHAIGKEKHEALSKLVEVYEVRTEEVFRAIAAGDLIVSYKTLNEQCQSCWEAETQLCLCCTNVPFTGQTLLHYVDYVDVPVSRVCQAYQG